MKIVLDNSGQARLAQPDDFRAFKVVCPTNFDNWAAALATIGRVEETHLWVPQSWIEHHGKPDSPQWTDGLQQMLKYAEKAGWIDAAGAVRAHVEFSDAPEA